MPSEELKNYIDEAKKSGMTDEQIRRELLNSEWKESDIDQFFSGGDKQRDTIQNESAELQKASQLLHSALVIFAARLKLAFKIVIIPAAIFLLYALVSIYVSSFLAGSVLGAIIIALLIIVLVAASAIFSAVAFISLVYLFSREEILTFSEYFKLGLKKFWPYIWVVFLMSFVNLGGYVLLIILGFIFSVWFSLAIYALIIEEKKGMEALMRSKHLVSGKFWKTVWRFLFLLLIGFAVLAPFWGIDYLIKAVDLSQLVRLVEYLIVFPLGVAYHVLFFKNLLQIKTEPFIYDQKLAKKFIAVGLVGILLLVAGIAFGGYYYLTKLKPLLQTPTITLPNGLADWQTYRNEQYGFEFKYPQDFVIAENDTTKKKY